MFLVYTAHPRWYWKCTLLILHTLVSTAHSLHRVLGCLKIRFLCEEIYLRHKVKHRNLFSVYFDLFCMYLSEWMVIFITFTPHCCFRIAWVRLQVVRMFIDHVCPPGIPFDKRDLTCALQLWKVSWYKFNASHLTAGHFTICSLFKTPCRFRAHSDLVLWLSKIATYIKLQNKETFCLRLSKSVPSFIQAGH